MTNQQDLITLCKKGDPKAYTELYNLYVRQVYNAICRYVSHTGEAEDLLQETFVDAYKNIGKLNNSDSFGPWVKRIAINKAINSLRNKKLLFTQLEPESIPFDESEIDEEAFEFTMKHIHEAIEALPASYKTVFQLYAIENIPQGEIATLLGITHTGVRTLYFRAKQKLLGSLKEVQYEG